MSKIIEDNAISVITCIKTINKLNLMLLGAESNRIEVTPFYDTIIYNDIADIINDFENKGVSIKKYM